MHYIIKAKLTQIISYIIVGFFEKWAFLHCSPWLNKKSCPRVVFHLAVAAGTRGRVLWRYWELESGQIVRCDTKPRCCNLLTVAVKRKDDGELKKRLVLDLLRCVNLAVKDDNYRMTTLQDAIDSTRKGDFQVVFDLKSAFHHIRLHASSYELMGFKVIDEKGIITYHCYVVLVFGFKVAA
jgi:hypothetical protein